MIHQSKEMNELAADSLLKLILEHRRKTCDSTCTVSLFPLLAVYKVLVNREATDKELEYFT